jgi:hypothetical protein
MRSNARRRHPANCTLCGKQIQAKQPDRPHGDGRAHDKCIKRLNRAATPLRTSEVPSSAATVMPPRKRRRTVSDPGEAQNLSRLRTRAPRPTIIPPVKKAPFKADPVDIAALLDQTVARRMALIEAETRVVLEFEES